MLKGYMTRKQASVALDRTVQGIAYLVQNGCLRGIVNDGQWYILRADVRKWKTVLSKREQIKQEIESSNEPATF